MSKDWSQKFFIGKFPTTISADFEQEFAQSHFSKKAIEQIKLHFVGIGLMTISRDQQIRNYRKDNQILRIEIL